MFKIIKFIRKTIKFALLLIVIAGIFMIVKCTRTVKAEAEQTKEKITEIIK